MAIVGIAPVGIAPVPQRTSAPFDPAVYTALGALTAQVSLLADAVKENKDEVKGHLEGLESQVDALHSKTTVVEMQQKQMSDVQEGMRKKLAALTTLSTKTTGVIGVVTAVASGIFVGLIWIIAHWGEFLAILARIFTPDGNK